MGKHKLTTFVGGFERPVVWPHAWIREKTTGPERLAIAPAEDALGLLLDLSERLGPECYLLYIVTAGRGAVEPGRYESPPLRAVNISIFLRDFEEFLENDSRHSLWIVATDESGMLVYDRHGILYAYGPLDTFETRLTSRGLKPGPFTLPIPHIHHTHEEYDSETERLLSRWSWQRSDLHPED